MKVVIVGGVAGGASAAARIRRLDEHAQIMMIERSGYVSYANCGLPYYVGGVIKEQGDLTLQTPESFRDRFRIDVRVRQEVTAISPAEKTVTIRALDNGKVYTESYDKLLLAPGAKPTIPALPGIDNKRIFTLRTVEDTRRIRQFAEKEKPKSAVLAGGGFIGLEMAENLTRMGIAVTIIERANQLLAPLDADMASFVHAEMRAHGITLLDVRTVEEYQRGHLDGFRNIPLDVLREHLDEIDRGKPVYVNCQTGLRSYLACRLLTQHGFTCTHLSGGYSFYQVITQERQTAQSAYPCGMERV